METYHLESNITDSTPGHETGEAIMYILNDGRYLPTVKFDQNGISINRYDSWIPVPFENVMVAEVPVAMPLKSSGASSSSGSSGSSGPKRITNENPAPES